MSYTYNGTQIRIVHPVHSISVNNHNVVFADLSGHKKAEFANPLEAKAFVAFLIDSKTH